MKKPLLILFLSLFSGVVWSQNLTLLGHLSYNVTCAGVWHYVDSVNNEYALVGANNRVSIVDVTNPTAPAEVFSVPSLPGQNSLWRELKTYGKFAYAVSEGGGGVIVINLSQLPDTVTYTHWYGDSTIQNQLNTAHTIAAENGYLYIFGSNISVGGCIIADISNPAQPHFVGEYELNYIHDGYIRNDTLWAGEIYAGQFSVIDVTNKSNPSLVNTQATPGAFCHNVWLSDNGQYAYTTDEVGNAPLGSFRVDNVSNIQLKEVYFTDSLPAEEVHNVRVFNDYLINPSYGSQLTIVDGGRPENLIEIARAPTDFGSGQPYLCWDASPYLPSGNIIATDISGGLFIYSMDYKRACYLEGQVTDSLSGTPINNALVEILTTTKSDNTNLSGNYATGVVDAGSYDVRFSAPGYITKTITGVVLSNGVLTALNAELAALTVNGNVMANGQGAANVTVAVSNGVTTVTTQTDSSGNFEFHNVPSGNYTVTAAGWGYFTQCQNVILDGSSPVNFVLYPGYEDDFSTDNGWTVNSTCTTGAWVRDVPVQTLLGVAAANPGTDVSSDCSDKCFMTGNGGGNANFDDLDNGYTQLTSPVFDISNYFNPAVYYNRWYFQNNTVPAGNIDTLFIYLTNGLTTVCIDSVYLSNTTPSSWQPVSILITPLITPTANMQLIVRMEDKPASGNICEAGFDNFRIDQIMSVEEVASKAELKINPNPGNGMFRISYPSSVIKNGSYITVTDLSGREVYRTSATGVLTEIILPTSVGNGVYIVSLHNTVRPVNPEKLVKI